MARKDISSVTRFGNEERAQSNFVELYTTVTDLASQITAIGASAGGTAAAALVDARVTSASAAVEARFASASAANTASFASAEAHSSAASAAATLVDLRVSSASAAVAASFTSAAAAVSAVDARVTSASAAVVLQVAGYLASASAAIASVDARVTSASAAVASQFANLPLNGTAGVTGPATSVVGHVPTFNNVTGTLLRDTGGLYVDANQNVVVASAALTTLATDGFLYIPTCAGTPTGIPTSFAGRLPLVYDSTNDILYIYNGSWKGITSLWA